MSSRIYTAVMAFPPASLAAQPPAECDPMLLPFQGSPIETDQRDCWSAQSVAGPARFASGLMRPAAPAWYLDSPTRVIVGSVVSFRLSTSLRLGVVFSIRRECIDVVVFSPSGGSPQVLAVSPSAIIDVAGPAAGPLMESFRAWVEYTRAIPPEILRWGELNASERARIRYGSEAACATATVPVLDDLPERKHLSPPPQGPAAKQQRRSSAPYGAAVPLAQHDSLAILSTAPKPVKKALPEEAKAVLRQWVNDHSGSTRPTVDERRSLVAVTGLTIVQVETWFRHYRVRESMHYGPGISRRTAAALISRTVPGSALTALPAPMIDNVSSPSDSAIESACPSRNMSDTEGTGVHAPSSPESHSQSESEKVHLLEKTGEETKKLPRAIPMFKCFNDDFDRPLSTSPQPIRAAGIVRTSASDLQVTPVQSPKPGSPRPIASSRPTSPKVAPTAATSPAPVDTAEFGQDSLMGSCLKLQTLSRGNSALSWGLAMLANPANC